MKFNLLFLIIPFALISLFFIIKDLQGQTEFTFSGTAETDSNILSLDEDVWIKKIKVKVGDIVNPGDTLAILSRVNIERNELQYLLDIQQENLNDRLNQSQHIQEINTLLSQKDGELLSVHSEMNTLLAKDSLDQVYRNLIVGEKTNSMNVENFVKLEGLKAKIHQINDFYDKKLNELNQIYKSKAISISNNKIQKSQIFSFDDKFKDRLTLIAPIKAYVDRITEMQEKPIQAYNELVRLNPLKPSQVVGFIHETARVPFNIGDSVHLISAVRPLVKSVGMIIATSPKLVELPLRLRKFIEIRAWGRELLIKIPEQNEFYIGEKIIINLIPSHIK